MDECPYTTEVWDWASSILRQSNRLRGNIVATITTWKENYSENKEVNLYWTLIPFMIIWAIWKERNRHIFQNQIWMAGKIKETVRAMTREMVQSRNCQIGGVQLIQGIKFCSKIQSVRNFFKSDKSIGLIVTNPTKLIWVQTDIGRERYRVLFKITNREKKGC
jgi:hypothetical protein